MIKKLVGFRQDQIDFILKLPGIFSEHVRRAVDQYISKLMAEDASAPSLSKKGEKHGSK